MLFLSLHQLLHRLSSRFLQEDCPAELLCPEALRSASKILHFRMEVESRCLTTRIKADLLVFSRVMQL